MTLGSFFNEQSKSATFLKICQNIVFSSLTCFLAFLTTINAQTSQKKRRCSCSWRGITLKKNFQMQEMEEKMFANKICSKSNKKRSNFVTATEA